MTNFDMFTINMTKIAVDKTSHNKIMTLSNLAFLIGTPFRKWECTFQNQHI
jgi:hypothetical protein